MRYISKHIHKLFLLSYIVLKVCTISLFLQADTKTSQQESWIIVFVHGIMGIAPHINLQNVGLFIRDEIIDTVYARTVHRMRKDDYFYQDQAMQGFGLLPIDETKKEPCNASGMTAYIYNIIDTSVYNGTRKNYFYTYGWSGLLSRSQRYIESEGLLIGLNQLIGSFKLRGITPKVRVIGYSHGGNVCLNLARMHDEKYPDMEMYIDELITIGMPIQRETDFYIASPLFKKIYNIFSQQDIIQTIDFFSCDSLFSDREFTSRRLFYVPQKVSQINLKISRLKKSKMPQKKMQALCMDGLKKTNRSGQRKLLRDASPGHLELWFFGWTADKYRSYFPLYPLPAAVFIPYFINLAETYESEICNPYPITIDLRPELDYSIIAQKTKRNEFAYQIPFIDQSLFESCQQEALIALPNSSDKGAYQNKINSALKKAGEEYDATHPPIECITKKRRRKGKHRREHKKARALPSHYKFLEPLS